MSMIDQTWEVYSVPMGAWPDEPYDYIRTMLAEKTNYMGMTLEHILSKLKSGDLTAYIVTGPKTKLFFLTEFYTYPSGQEMNVVGVTGVGLVWHMRTITLVLERIMKANKCHFLRVHSANPMIQKLLLRARFTPLSTSYLRVRKEA